MKLGVLRLKLHFGESHSLKDKRRIVKSAITRLRNQFNVSVAEVEDQELWQIATLGVASVSNHHQRVDQVLSQIVDFITRNYPEVEMVDRESEILPIL
ncbi:MAG: DUF503 domain-containing protein [Chloroflexota bacterium]